MKRFISILAFFVLPLYSTYGMESNSNHDYWKRLLHFNETQSRVISEEFFLSPEGKNDPIKEMQETIHLLNSANGASVACNFPARYKWLSSQQNNIPYFDLTQCAELQEFLRGFQSETMSIVFVSEFVDVPASAFGHIMLAFNNTETPLPLADTIHFSAVTRQESFMQYAYKGLTGKFDGYFFRNPLFLKLHEYSIKEQRALHFYQLDFSTEDILRIRLHLYELRKARFSYYFVRENCAYQIGQLLNIALPNEYHDFSNFNAVLPIDIVHQFSNHIIKHQASPPSLLHAERLLSDLSSNEENIIKDVINQKSRPLDSLPSKIKEILSIHYQYAFRRQGVIYENFNEVRALHYEQSPSEISLTDPLKSHATARAQIGVRNLKQELGLLLGFRPLLRDIYIPQQNALQESELSILDGQMLASSSSIRVERLDILKIRSLPRSNILRHDLSWNVFVGLNRENQFKETQLEAELGLGESIGHHQSTLSGSVSLGVQKNSNDATYIKPSVSAFHYFPSGVKMGVQISNRLFNTNRYIHNELFFSHSYGYGHATIRLFNSSADENTLEVSYSFSL